jgi:hypothetical protein
MYFNEKTRSANPSFFLTLFQNLQTESVKLQLMQKQWINVLIVGMALGTAWAVRGQFGHEQGAAWAGGIGALALLMVSGRNDWGKKALAVVMASAAGWGASGMISYGQIVGYGRADNFLNAAYGLLMLFVIGNLYGLLGGGMVGLSLISGRQHPVKWYSLVTGMTAGGVVAWYFLIEQLGLLMTPPRSEAWAVCLGAAAVMIWYMVLNRLQPALKVALFSSLGAGFGFAFGNFLQIAGNVLQINFNMWNVMEYSIGFFGGCAMAYAVFTTEWTGEKEALMPEKWEDKLAFLFCFVLIPLLVFQQSSGLMRPLLSHDSASASVTLTGSLLTLALMVAMIFAAAAVIRVTAPSARAFYLFALYALVYILASYSVSGAWKGEFLLNHHLYLINLVVILLVARRHFPSFFNLREQKISASGWIKGFLSLVLVILLLSLIAISMHGELPGSNLRF